MGTTRINERQRALLERIANGAEPVTSAEYTLATTVYALRGRKLVRTVRRSGGWVAEITVGPPRMLQREPWRDEAAVDRPACGGTPHRAGRTVRLHNRDRPVGLRKPRDQLSRIHLG